MERIIEERKSEAGGSETQSRAASNVSATGNSRLISRRINVLVSYLEIYNEIVNDLLDVNKKNLNVREGGKDGVVVERLTYKAVKSTK